MRPPQLPLAAFLLLLLLLGPPNRPTTTTTTFYRCQALSTATSIAVPAKNENNLTGRRIRSRRPEGKTYHYFAFGSNMASSTMTDLRGISPLNSSAAVLPGHVLRFNVPGLPLIEPSSASVEPAALDDDAVVVHGVLYELTERDFATICRTEGVPFVYALHRCRAFPYVGDGRTAGEDALRRSSAAAREAVGPTPGAGTDIDLGVSAFTLRASRDGWRRGRDIPPSRSYLNVLLRGVREFALDEAHLRHLEGIRCGRTLFGDGVAGGVLRLAEERHGGGGTGSRGRDATTNAD